MLKISLFFILGLGLLLRVINISANPPSLYGDELTIVYDSYSILKTGHDSTGQFLPIVFRLGAGRLPGYVYGSIPFVALFGPTAPGVRALSILSGLGIILLLYLLGQRLFGKKVGILASFLAATSPWDINLSRAGFEAHFALFSILLGVTALLYFEKNKWFLALGALSLMLASQTYPTYKLTLVLFLPLVIWFSGVYRRLSFKNLGVYSLSGFILFCAVVFAIFQTFSTSSETRFGSINIFSQMDLKQKVVQEINYDRTISSLPDILKPYFLNQPISYLEIMGRNYFSSLSWDFLFLEGDRSPRHNMSGMGELYLAEIITITLGVLFLWQKYKKTLLFFTCWILISPVPTAILGDPHALRNSLMYPPLGLLSASGLYYLLSSFRLNKSTLLILILGAVFFIQFFFFIERLFFLSPNQFVSFWAYSAKVASELAIKNRDKFNYILVSNRIDGIDFAYPVYAKIDPNVTISQNKRGVDLSGVDAKKYDNVYIGYFPDTQEQSRINALPGSVLYIGTPDEAKYLHDYHTIIGPDGFAAVSYTSKR